MPAEISTNSHLETDLWRWLLFESGLTRRRAREIILQGAQSNALSLFWEAGPTILAQQLGLSSDEAAGLSVAQADWARLRARFEQERGQGLMTLRINEVGYPDSLARFLPLQQRPLLLFLRGDASLLDLPLALSVAETPPDEAAIIWALETLADLTAEGALALFVARVGFDARLVRMFLDAEMPFALVIPRGLNAYQPPTGLQRALDAGRVLLLSPFGPDWRPAADGEAAISPHAAAFARALAHAWLLLSAPAPQPAPGQPCFCAPSVVDENCPDIYDGAEGFFLRLAEGVAPIPPGVNVSAPQPPPAQEPVDPTELLETLARGGRVPPALARRLKHRSQNHP